MIRLRRTLERGRAHPVLGPIVVLMLVLLLVLVSLHAVLDGQAAATEVGALCLVVLTILGPLVVERMRRTRGSILVAVRGDRGPPISIDVRSILQPAPGAPSFATPLRR